ncbi:MAG: ABC transporter substrate-binding protein [Planctomycetota bacterium]
MRIRLLTLMLGTILGWSCTQRDASEVPDENTERALPQRIVVLGPSTAENLFAMQQGHRVVGVSDYNTLPEASELPRVGGLADPSLERILALAPDMVLVQGNIPRVEQVCKASDIAFHAFKTDTLEEWSAELEWLGEHVGPDVEARRVREGFEAELEQLQVLGLSVAPKVLLVIFRREDEASGMMVAGDQGFLHELLVAVGGENVLQGSGQDYFDLNEERLVRLAPDLILEFQTDAGAEDRTSLDAAALKIWERDFPSLPAVKNGRVHTLTGKDLLIPGPSMLETARQIGDRISGR